MPKLHSLISFKIARYLCIVPLHTVYTLAHVQKYAIFNRGPPLICPFQFSIYVFNNVR